MFYQYLTKFQFKIVEHIPETKKNLKNMFKKNKKNRMSKSR